MNASLINSDFSMYDQLLSKILCRTESKFALDITKHDKELKDTASDSRILIIGAAGSIGAAFVKQVLNYDPGILHLIDLSENNLVELVRDLRASSLKVPKEFRTLAIGLGTYEFEAFLRSSCKYDYVVNFAALKHVRSERDPFTLMRMLSTNVFYVKQLLDLLTGSDIQKFFSVSSDKAVNPVSIMGATKAFMERVMFLYSDKVPCSTSRFANVAFSEGSLLSGFYRRLEKKQPISAPSDVKRYFISHEEAGQLCLLSCFLGENRDIYFPKLDKDSDMCTFSEIATIFLEANGYRPVLFPSADEAKKAAIALHNSSAEWPCYFSEADTTGEKLYEEFYRENDAVEFNTYNNIGVIHGDRLDKNSAAQLQKSFDAFQKIRNSLSWGKEDIVDAIQLAIPEIQHEDKGKDLDQKM